MKIFILFVVLFMTLITSLYSQTNVSVNIKGQVVDSLTNETVPYATIRISEKASPDVMLKGVATDDNGRFYFKMDKKGDYFMTIQYVGKNEIKEFFTVEDKKMVDFGRLLMADNTQALGEIVVSAQRPLVKVDLDKITYSLDEDPESKTNNVLEMLKKVPLITIDGEENIQLKGSSSYKIYLNGKPSTMISSNPKDVLRSMPANTIKDIEVITDPGAKYDAEGIAGIINIITHKNSSLGGYTATLNAGADSRGGFNGGAYWSIKYGKVGFTGNYNYYDYKRPRGSSSYMQENLRNDTEKFLSRNGSNKNEGNGQYGSGELSYEIDTLNLINIGFNRYEGNYTSFEDLRSHSTDINNNTQYIFNRKGKSKENYGNTAFNVDYQRTFNKKDQLLTFSYRFNLSPNDRESDGVIDVISGTPPPSIKTIDQYTDANTTEHTFQGDFTTPLGKIHILETGLKYILRNNKSNSGTSYLDNTSGNWDAFPSFTDKFKHENDILAAYAGYSAKLQKWGFKTGLRFESTSLDVKFPLASSMGMNPSPNFKTDYNNFVPSATITYQIKPSQNIRFGYNMRIWRPGIWQLNPYENNSDPNNIQKGNPDLDAVKNHSLNANYMFFNPKLNVNVNASYSFDNNSIQEVTSSNSGVSKITTTSYENIGKNRNLDVSAYINWSATPKLRIYTNLRGGYTDIKANNGKGLTNHGFLAGAYAGVQYTLPWTLRANLNGGYWSPWISLQGESSSSYFHSFSLMKSFLSERLTFNGYIQNPFNNKVEYTDKRANLVFHSRSEVMQSRRQFGIRVSFRFGEMKSQIQKTKRGINNDDSSGGGSQGGGENQGGPN